MQKSRGTDYPKFLLYTLAFIIPVIVMLVVFWQQDFYPFGNKTLFTMDMRDQYVAFFASLRNILSGDASLFFSWSRSMGGNYLGLFAYYIASPLSWITVLFPVENLMTGVLLLTLLKTGLCGLSFTGFAEYIWQRGEKDGKGYKKLVILPFSICYALMSYNMVYSMCLMWLDGVIFLPVVLTGIEKIFDMKRMTHYVISLAVLFICNYYTGYMVGIFTGIYFLFRLFCNVEKDSFGKLVKKTCRFIAGTLYAVALSAPVLLPVVMDLMNGKLATPVNLSVAGDTANFNPGLLPGKLLNGAYDSITNSGLPSIYCGYLALALAVLFLFLKSVSWKEKLCVDFIVAFLCYSFYNKHLDMVWHGLQVPNWFPYRYAFVFSFFLLYLALRTVMAITAEGKKQIFIKTGFLEKAVFWIVTSCVLTVIVSFDMEKNAEGVFEGLNGEFPYFLVQDYKDMAGRTQPLINKIKENDDSFYRINQYYEFSKNDAMLFGYNGMTHYSSTFNAGINSVTPKLGLAQSHIWNSGYGSNLLLDSLFSVKYILDDGKVPAGYEKYAENTDSAGNTVSAYSNKYALPVVYSAPSQGMEPDLETGNVFKNQNNFLNQIAGTDENYFTDYGFQQSQSGNNYIYTFTAGSSDPVYLYMQSDMYSYADVYVNDEWVGNYFTTETTCSLFLGNFTPGQQVMVCVVPQDTLTINYALISSLDTGRLADTLDILRAGGMQVDKHKGGRLSGRINVKEGETVITSIPYDSGWTVKVDGRKADIEKYAGTFIAVQAEPGLHKISFSYISPGFIPGIAVSAATCIVFMLQAAIRRRHGR